MMRPDFRERVVLVTGAAQGIGRRMALRFHAAGATIVAWDVDAAGLESLVAEVGGERAHGHVCDLADPGAIATQSARVLAEVGPVDVLVNNAGVVSGRPLLELEDGDVERTLNVNTLSLFRTTRAFLPSMIARDRGTVVTISSAAGLVGVAGLTDYCASKWAAVGFDEALRAELGKQGSQVRTLIVCPHYIDTGMFSGVRTRFPRLLPILDPDDVAARIVGAVAEGRARLLLPRFVWATLLARSLPVPLFDRVAGFFGINSSMDHFVGKRGGRGGPRGL